MPVYYPDNSFRRAQRNAVDRVASYKNVMLSRGGSQAALKMQQVPPAFDPMAPLPLTTQQIRVINDSPAIPFDVIMTATNAPNAGPPWSYTVPVTPPAWGDQYAIDYTAGMWQLSALLFEVVDVLYSTNMSPATSLPVTGWTVEGPGGQTYITAV